MDAEVATPSKSSRGSQRRAHHLSRRESARGSLTGMAATASGIAETAPRPQRRPRPGWRVRLLRWLAVLAVFLGIVVIVVNVFADEPLRRYLERRVNESLDGYTVSIGKLRLHLLGLAVDLQEVSVIQNQRPRPPVAYLPSWETSVEWRALLSLAVVADATFDRPQVFLTTDQAVQEAKDPKSVSDRGWQDALTAVYPLKVNRLRVTNGTLTYFDGSEGAPVRLDGLQFVARNIRNVQSHAGQYPSPIELDTTIFKTGQLHASGSADFFFKPSPAMVADFTLRDMTLEPLAKTAQESGIHVAGGMLAAEGHLTQVPPNTQLALKEVVVSKPVLEYVRRPETRDREDVEEAKKAAETVTTVIDDLRVQDGTLTYQAPPPSLLPPLRLEKTNLRVTSIGYPPAPRGKLPSLVELDTSLLGTGSLRVRGRADVNAKPAPVGDLTFGLKNIELTRFDQMVKPYGLTIAGGILSSDGELTRTPEQTKLLISQVDVAKPVVEYVQVTQRDEERVETATKKTTESREKPPVRVDLDHAHVTDGLFGFSDKKATYPYRLFLSDTDVTLEGFSNERSKRDGIAHVSGRFMDSGPAVLDARFEGGGAGKPEFELDLRVDDVQLVTLNDLLRSAGGFDVVRGQFSFYTHFIVRDGRVDGYVKPFFKDMDVYDSKQEAGKSIGQKLYELVVGGAATVLQNRFEDQVATRAQLSGPVQHPDASTWQIVMGLLRNAFWRALLPGLDRGAERGAGAPP
jgi:hypothetical protein